MVSFEAWQRRRPTRAGASRDRCRACPLPPVRRRTPDHVRGRCGNHAVRRLPLPDRLDLRRPRQPGGVLLTSFLVMPAWVLVGLLMMPLGLEGPFFRTMTWGCEGSVDRPRHPRRPARRLRTGAAMAGSALALLAAGGVWLALWQRHGAGPAWCRWLWRSCWRWWTPPDLLIDAAMGMAAVRGGDGEVTLVEWRRYRLGEIPGCGASACAFGRKGTRRRCRPTPRRHLRQGRLHRRSRRGKGVPDQPGRGGGRGLPRSWPHRRAGRARSCRGGKLVARRHYARPVGSLSSDGAGSWTSEAWQPVGATGLEAGE